MRKARLFAVAFLGAIAMAASTFGISAASDAPLRIGVRADAPPFSYKTPTGGFDGYLVEICRRAAQKLGRNVTFVEVAAATRFDKIDADEVDFLCDPTTVSISRVKEYDFSPTLFISGSSYLTSGAADDKMRVSSWDIFDERAANKAPVRNRFGDEMNADGVFPDPKIGAIAELPSCADVDADPNGRILGARVGMLGETPARAAIEIASQRNIIRMNKHDTACIDDRFATHTEGVLALCRGDISYYFGDRDILVSVLANVTSDLTDACDAFIAKEFFTIEPYGLVLSDSNHTLRRELISAILAIHREQVKTADGGVELLSQQMFRRHFPNKRPSELLTSLYVILNAPE